MEKIFNFKFSMKQDELGETTIAPFIVPDEEIDEWCLALTLLKYDLLDAVIPSKKMPFQIQKMDNKREKKRTPSEIGYCFQQASTIILVISEELLDTWLSWYLEYYRDGKIHLGHIDYTFYARPKMPSTIRLEITLKLSKALLP
jgi:hypothetical protein